MDAPRLERVSIGHGHMWALCVNTDWAGMCICSTACTVFTACVHATYCAWQVAGGGREIATQCAGVNFSSLWLQRAAASSLSPGQALFASLQDFPRLSGSQAVPKSISFSSTTFPPSRYSPTPPQLLGESPIASGGNSKPDFCTCSRERPKGAPRRLPRPAPRLLFSCVC